MSRQLPQQPRPLLTDGKRPKRRGIPITTIVGFTFMGGLIFSILGIGALQIFPEIGDAIRIAVGLPITAPPAPDTTGIQLTAQVLSLTQTALAGNPPNSTIPTATPYLPDTQAPLPTYTPLPSLPTYTPLPPLPTYTPLAPLPTYTPYPTADSGSGLPTIAAATQTTEPNLIFQDTFDNAIDTGHWQTFGTWIIGKDGSNGYPLLFEDYKPKSSKSSVTAFSHYYDNNWYYRGGMIFPGTSQMNNIAIEFDRNGRTLIEVLLSYEDEFNYKEINMVDGHLDFEFVSDGKTTTIPQSFSTFSNGSGINLCRIEIRGNALAIYVNGELVYDVRDLPEKVNGVVGIGVSNKGFVFDNFKIYQLP